MKRVDFAVIAKTTNDAELESVPEMANVIGDITKDLIGQMESFGSVGDIQIKKIKINPGLKEKLNRRVLQVGKKYWGIGVKHARTETDKAKGMSFSMNINEERVDFVSKEFLAAKAFNITGNLSDDIMKVVNNLILNGVKGDKTYREISEDIYRNLASSGLVSEDVLSEALGYSSLRGIENPSARLDTMVRTYGTEAINEARYSYFTDPSLNGFVEAFEYSAVMDGDRTTQICQHLDGHIHSVNSDVWKTYKPPNHYNCRSILVPVTSIDTWTESEYPDVEPQKGFK